MLILPKLQPLPNKIVEGPQHSKKDMASSAELRVLHSVYNFDHLSTSDSQEEARVSALSQLLRDFAIASNNSTYLSISDVLVGAVDQPLKIVRWFPQYGCVLFASAPHIGVHPQAQVHLNLLALDGWDFRMHGLGFASKSTSGVTLCVGDVMAIEFSKFYNIFSDMLTEAQQRHGDKRHAGTGQGHQKTPTFIAAVLTDAVDLSKEEVKTEEKSQTAPQGGFTDVGQHTGGRARDTCWALVAGMAGELIAQHSDDAGADPTVVFQQMLTELDFWVLDLLLEELSAGCTPTQINACMVVLGAAGEKVSTLAANGVDTCILDLEARCHHGRSRLDKIVAVEAVETAKKCLLPDLNREKIIVRDVAVQFSVEQHNLKPERVQLTADEVQSRAMANLGHAPVRTANSCTVAELLIYVSSLGPSAEKPILLLSAVESSLWEWADLLQPDSESSVMQEPNAITDLEEVLTRYRTTMVLYLKSRPANSDLRAVLRSREMLAVWVAYCLVFQECHRIHTLMREFGVALRGQDLRHLVLSDSSAWMAACSVHYFLLTHTKANTPLFSLRNNPDQGSMQVATFRFGELFANQSTEMKKVLLLEQDKARRRTAQHWNEVEAKQDQARTLRNKIKLKEEELVTKELEERRDTSYSKRAYVDSLKSEINRYNEQLRQVLKPPLAEIMALPQNPELARKVIFFQHMPENLRALSRLSFAAQEMLMPRTFMKKADAAIVSEATKPAPVKVQMYDHCRINQGQQHKSPPLDLASDQAAADPSDMGIRGGYSVDEFSSPTQGIWYPDKLCQDSSLSILWTSPTQNKRINPFIADLFPLYVSADFTETLSGEGGESKLSWALQQPGFSLVDNCRSNVGIADQEGKPTEMDKDAYLCFAAVRAYPLQQVRKICSALHNRSLLLEDQATRVLFVQSLCHLGDFYESASPTYDTSILQWKQDWFAGDWLRVLTHELHAMVDEMANSPQRIFSLRVCAELASFVVQFEPACVAVCREIAGIAHRFASELEAANPAGQSSAMDSESLTKQRVYNLVALLTYSNGVDKQSPDGDAFEMCKLMVLVNKLKIFEPEVADYPSTAAELETVKLVNHCSALTALAAAVMARHIYVLATLQEANKQNLTALVKLVMVDIELSGMSWERLAGSACFQSTHEGHAYHINLLSGVVLYDGIPPSSLPINILRHPQYVRTFEQRDFHAVHASDGWIKTVKAYNGSLYEFFLVEASNELLVRESTLAENMTMELMSGLPDAPWFGDLPLRLREMHSHWFWGEKSAIVLRGINFADKLTSFLICFDAANSLGNGSWACLRVPDEMKSVKDGFAALFSALTTPSGSVGIDRLVFLSNHTHLLDVTAKFEEIRFTEIYENSASGNELMVVFPRYHLHFILRDGQLCSADFDGFHLAKCQQFSDTLLFFNNYLLLKSGSEEIMVVPFGHVPVGCSLSFNDFLSVTGSKLCNVVRPYYKYSIDERFEHICAVSVASRLHLACLYAACGTRLPEDRQKETGCEVALTLVRQSWMNKPLEEKEQSALINITKFTQLSPALSMLCHELYCSSVQMLVMYPDLSQEASQDTVPLDSNAVTKYMRNRRSVSARGHLEATEELRIGGLRKVDKHIRGSVPHLEVDREQFIVPLDEVIKVEETLATYYVSKPRLPTEVIPALPINVLDFQTTQVGSEVAKNLLASWNTYHSSPTVSLAFDLLRTVEELGIIATTVAATLTLLEKRIISTISETPGTERLYHHHTTIFRIAKATNEVPTVNRVSLMRIACRPETMRQLNPFLTTASTQFLLKQICLWLQLCVLDDKMNRMLALTAEPQLLAELQVRRVWAPSEHVQWLVFEAERHLQIRPIQYHVAQSLIDSVNGTDVDAQGLVGQLNMGEGKTRVILPMLVLHCANGQVAMRVHFLSQLLRDAYEYLHGCLCASVLQRKLFLVPFNRDVQISANMVDVLRSELEHCRNVGGCVCSTPESRLSLQLKRHELLATCVDEGSDEGSRKRRAICDKLDLLQKSLPFVDVHDESDLLLHHKYQLVYAVGDRMQLPGGVSRWHAVQAILRIINTSPDVERILRSSDGAAVFEQVNQSKAWHGLRLLPGVALNKVAQEFVVSIARKLVDKPPPYFAWMGKQSEELKADFVIFITNSSLLGTTTLHSALKDSASQEMQDLLALRGMLACSNSSHSALFHCLQKRHRIDYGVKRPGKLLLAVPFRAADTPSERAEFGHPDSAIAFTTLAYYRDGLDTFQLIRTVKKLQKLGATARNSIFAEWLGCAAICPATRERFSCLDKVDLSNSTQFAELHSIFRRNMEAVNFFLSHIVFPSETMQYPQRLMANAWNLCDNAAQNPIGFSGTADNKLLLPLQVKQPISSLPEVAATDGKMVSLIARNREYTTLTPAEGEPLWKGLLRYAVANKFCALIDAGGLVSGVNGLQAAEELLSMSVPLSTVKQAVVYFHHGEWRVRDKRGRDWLLHSSPIREKDAFVLFDDSHCRGADMKLPALAKALLTVGPKMCKDKLMQAAGRMRQLDKQQSIAFVGTQEVSDNICLIAGGSTGKVTVVDSLHLLQWVTHNTIAAVAPGGLMEWAKQGLHFTHTAHSPAMVVQDEDVRLQTFYERVVTNTKLSEIHNRMRKRWQDVYEEKNGAGLQEVVSNPFTSNIATHITKYGQEFSQAVSGLEEECERELEQEEELEEELELVPPAITPVDEVVWLSLMALSTTSASTLVTAGMQLPAVISRSFSAADNLDKIAWSNSIFCTENFVNTTFNKSQGTQRHDIAQYLRPLDACLYFQKDKTVLLISEREADFVLSVTKPVNRSSESLNMSFKFVHLAYARTAECQPELRNELENMLGDAQELPTAVLASLMLFNGETSYPTPALKKELARLVSFTSADGLAKAAAMAIPSMRGLGSNLSRSDLADACIKVEA